MINDILDLSKIEAGKTEFRPEAIQLTQVVEEACSIVKPMVESKRLAMSISIEEAVQPVFLDPAKLKQVLYNYLSNAVKFTAEEGSVGVSVVSEGPHAFRIEVSDTGVGIAESEIPRLFAEFQQLDDGASKKYQGTGLGLALTKRIVEAQGGSVGVRSTLRKGSAFWAILPRQVVGIQA